MQTPSFSPSRLAIALSLALVCAPVCARPVPAGFEDLAAGQTEQLDVRLMGRSAGIWPVFVTPDGVRLLEPVAVLAALELTDEAQAALVPALSATLPRNGHLACQNSVADAGCGYLAPPEDPAAIGVIHDENEGVLNLFPARQWLPTSRPVRERYHRPSERAQNAFLHQQMVNVSGGRDYMSVSALGNGMLGVLRDTHVGVDWNYNRQQSRRQGGRDDFSFNDVYLRHDLARQHYVQVGRMDRRNLSSAQGGNFAFAMLPLDRFEGARFGTTQAYLDHAVAGQGSPLTVLLSRQARVDAYDGERLLQTFYLDSGINDLDTTRFPAGSYLVSLRIFEDGVLVRTEDAPFSKSGATWDDSSVQWFVQGGRLITDDDRDHDGAVQAGIRMPLRRNLAMTLGSAIVDDTVYGELRLEGRKALGTHEFTGSSAVLRGDDGSHGLQQQATYRHRVSGSVYHQRMRGGACRGNHLNAESLGCSDALSASLSAPLPGGNLYVGYTRRTTYTLGRDDLDRPWFGDGVPPGTAWLPGDRQGRLTRTLQANYSRSVHWRGMSIATRTGVFTQRADASAGPRRDQGVYLNLTVSRVVRAPTATRQDRIGLDLQHGRDEQADVGYRVGTSRRWERGTGYRELGGELSGRSDHQTSVAASVRQQDDYGSSAATVSRYRYREQSEMSYTATHTSSFAWSRAGFFWGSEYGSGAGLAVQVRQPDDLQLSGHAAEVRVAGARRQLLRFGQRRLLPLSSYTLTHADVQDVSSHDIAAAVRVDGQGSGHALFLPPGKIWMMPIELDLTYTFIGSAHDEAGHALHGARILNAPLPSLGNDGGFVADFPQREKTLYLLQESRLLECPLQVREQRSVVFLVGKVRCQPLAAERLPAKIQQQARVQRLLREEKLGGDVPSVAGRGASL
ncbi:TcfC E-set like domain-containing protein [Stenotrophomonas sp. BIGb0135]|uniref:TcfC E-set like domain-containing protein n=1 Tax=Stenotrophomonas sp. BIGb0135 TaxID=2940620 RepID=UPI0021674B6C|nr:TcfC E-set like domain-containing protein [Stenotrophomonas sp. BIGb0135]MCS4235517.1 hypothetical protein [Stenotrophomonas sp. BIGb0135]